MLRGAQVCLGQHPALAGEQALGRCARATVRYAAAYSTKIAYASCTGDAVSADCAPGWTVEDVADGPAAVWERSLGLPPDPIAVETINDPIFADVSLVEPVAHDGAVLGAGISATAATAAVVALARWRYHAHLKAQ